MAKEKIDKNKIMSRWAEIQEKLDDAWEDDLCEAFEKGSKKDKK